MKFNFNIGTFNVRGLTIDYKRERLSQDLSNYHLDILCIQESKTQQRVDYEVGNNRLILLNSKSQHYGNGFLISNKWKSNVYKYWKVSDRISILQLEINTKTEKKENPIKHYKTVAPLKTIIGRNDFKCEQQANSETKLKISWKSYQKTPPPENKIKLVTVLIHHPQKSKTKILFLWSTYMHHKVMLKIMMRNR